jgi:hypothetical protein
MGNTQANLVAAFERPETVAAEAEQPRNFHFAVTWVTLFAHLDLMESSGPVVREPSAPVLDLVPVVSPPLEPAPRDPVGGWEMVVPKMIRTGPGQFAPVDATGRDS